LDRRHLRRRLHSLDTSTGKLTTLNPSTAPVDLVPAPDGSWLAVATAGDRTEVWATASWSRRSVIGGGPPLAVSPDAARIVTALKRAAGVFDLSSGQLVGTLRGKPRHANISPDGAWIACDDANGTVRLWDASSLHLRYEVSADGPLTGLLAGEHGDWMAAVGRGSIRIWHPHTQQALGLARLDDEILRCAEVADGYGLAVAGRKGVYIFDLILLPGEGPGHDGALLQQRGHAEAANRSLGARSV